MCLFFFSSRRRHTRFDCDWSSDCALPIYDGGADLGDPVLEDAAGWDGFPSGPEGAPNHSQAAAARVTDPRSEEHTSELQSQSNLVCRLLLEKKKKLQRSSACIIQAIDHAD